MDNGSPLLSQPGLVSLLAGIVNDARTLLLQEVALAKLEVQYELRKAKTAAVTLGIGILVAALGGILVALMVVHLLAALTVVPLWGCYGIVGGALVILGGVLLAARGTRAEDVDGVRERMGQGLKESVQWPRQQTTSDKNLDRTVKISRTPARQ